MYILSLFFFILEKKRCHVAIDICRSCMIDQFCIQFAPSCTEKKIKKNIKSNMEQFKKIKPIKCLSQTLSMVIDLTEIGRS